MRRVFTGTLIAGLALAMSAFSSPPATHSTTHGTMFGATIPNQSAFTRDTSQFGHMAIIHTYYSGLPLSDAWSRGIMASTNAAVIVSFNAKPSAVLSGKDDSVLAHFFDTAPSNRTVFWSYIHEPEHAIAHEGLNLAQYKQAWVKIAQIADAAHNPDLRATLILEAYDLKPSTHRDWKDYLPAGNVISVLGWDAYPGAGDSEMVPPATFMGPAVAASKAAHMPFGFPEFGMTSQPGQAAWLTSVGAYIKGSGALFGTLFDSQPPGKPPLVLTNPASIAAWAAVVRSSN